VTAVVAAQQQEAVRPDAALREGVEFVSHKLRQVGASHGLSLLEEGGDVLVHCRHHLALTRASVAPCSLQTGWDRATMTLTVPAPTALGYVLPLRR